METYGFENSAGDLFGGALLGIYACAFIIWLVFASLTAWLRSLGMSFLAPVAGVLSIALVTVVFLTLLW